MTQRTELFFDMTQRNWTFLLNVTQRIEPFFLTMWYKEFFHKHDSKHLTLFKNMTQELNYFEKLWLTELNPSY